MIPHCVRVIQALSCTASWWLMDRREAFMASHAGALEMIVRTGRRRRWVGMRLSSLPRFYLPAANCTKPTHRSALLGGFAAGGTGGASSIDRQFARAQEEHRQAHEQQHDGRLQAAQGQLKHA